MMGRSLLVAGMALVAIGLTACNNAEHQRSAGSRICTPFTEAETTPSVNLAPGAPAPVVAVEPSAALDDCLHRWGYTLATSTDGAEAVSQAVVAACTPALTRWNQQTMMAAGAQGAPESAPSLLTGESTTPIAEHFNYAQNRALFYVVQGRAGKCAPPPAPKPAKK